MTVGELKAKLEELLETTELTEDSTIVASLNGGEYIHKPESYEFEVRPNSFDYDSDVSLFLDF